MEKSNKFEWTEDCRTDFRELKSKLIEAPILTYPQSQGSFILGTDLSDFGIGAVLSQELTWNWKCDFLCE